MEELNDISLMIKQGTPLIVIESREEPRVLELCTRLAMKTFRQLHRWSATDGLVKGGDTGLPKNTEYTEPGDLLRHIRQGLSPGIYVLCDFHPYLDDPLHIRQLKDIALYGSGQTTLVFVSHAVKMPADIHPYSRRFELRFPSHQRIHEIIIEEARQWQQSNQGKQVKTDQATLQKLIGNLQGLTESDVKHLVRGAIVTDGAITLDDVESVNQTKFELMNMNNILSYEYDTSHFSDVGGLHGLKRWLAQRKSAFMGNQGGNKEGNKENDKSEDTPKGIMLLGVQGGGKSLAAKAIAGLWKVPLLRLDMGALYNKFHGETERNLRETLQLADNIAPCVLWMDEVEKSLAQSDNEGIGKRILGSLLTWMAERKSRVFIVCTSNDISQLPPELIRKGRLDEIFFVDLPNREDRQTITRIHLEKRQIQLGDTDINHIADISENFTGAEIEQAVVSSLYAAKAKERDVTLTDLQAAIASTVPISVTRKEEILSLQHWARDRAVSAND